MEVNGRFWLILMRCLLVDRQGGTIRPAIFRSNLTTGTKQVLAMLAQRRFPRMISRRYQVILNNLSIS